MNSPSGSNPPQRFRLFRNWLSASGLVVAAGSLFAFLLLFLFDSLAGYSNPYVGILTYLVAPGFLLLGLLMTVLGAWLFHRKGFKSTGVGLRLQMDLSRARDRRMLLLFIALAGGFLFISAVGSYYSYHFTESVQFCGQVCHTVMEPEMTTYQHSPHARVACTACHIGPGATWFVRSKLSGLYQVYATIANKYPTPIPTPVENLRPAQETCEQCHWPQQFVGNTDRTYVHFLGEETNPVYAVRMLLKVGGADPRRGPVGGIHWHMSVANKVQYYPSDKSRQKIPWVRLINSQGAISEYRSPSFTNQVNESELRTMDCIDCHNRPSHRYSSPNAAVDLALSLGKLDPALPWIKTNAVWVLTRPCLTSTQALENIATTLKSKYPNDARLALTTATVQQIYRENFFPQMKAEWADYPDNIGHKDWPGCTRCHDDQHRTRDGRVIGFKECVQCHLIVAQGNKMQLDELHGGGLPFEHPGEDYGEMQCRDCHTGAL